MKVTLSMNVELQRNAIEDSPTAPGKELSHKPRVQHVRNDLWRQDFLHSACRISYDVAAKDQCYGGARSRGGVVIQ